MNTRFAALCAAAVCLAAPACLVNADQKPTSPAADPRVVTEKNVVGDWQTRGEGWRMVLSTDHTAAVYSEGVFESKPSFTTWKLVGNHVVIRDASLFKMDHYEDLGSDFMLIPYKDHLVMLLKKELPVAEKRGFAACNCLWRSSQKSDKGKY